jgi:hypothetical protein
MPTGPLGPLLVPLRPRRSLLRHPWYWLERLLIAAGLVLIALLVSSCVDDPFAPGEATVELAASEAASTTVTTSTVVSTTEPPSTTARPTTTKQPVTTKPKVKATSPSTTRRPTPPATRAPASDCHPSYSGACLRTSAGDYDCAGGSGNGPNYVQGPIRVRGEDPFDLDRDGDGEACEA